MAVEQLGQLEYCGTLVMLADLPTAEQGDRMPDPAGPATGSGERAACGV